MADQANPGLPSSVHFLGMGGRLVGGLAIALHRLGVRVSGVDDAPWPEVVALLRHHGLALSPDPHAADLPDGVNLVLAGAIATPQRYPAWQTALARGIPVQEPTEFLQRTFLQGGKNLVVVGTKGKTTTTAMLAWIARASGTPADHLFGGTVPGLDPVSLQFHPLRLLEGDEYPRSTTDLRTKFSGYRPDHLVITNLRHDHRDIYRTPAAYLRVFAQAVERLPPGSSLTVPEDDKHCQAWARGDGPAAETVGWSGRAGHRLTGFQPFGSGCRFFLGRVPFRLLIPGRFNALNAALASVAALRVLGVELADSAAALESFPGVSGRLQRLWARDDQLLYRDDGYLPFALSAVLEALRSQHPTRHLTVIFQPRYTATSWPSANAQPGATPSPLAEQTLGELVTSLGVADRVLLLPPSPLVPEDQGFSSPHLARLLQAQGCVSRFFENPADLLAELHAEPASGPEVILASVGLDQQSFHDQLRHTLEAHRSPTPSS